MNPDWRPSNSAAAAVAMTKEIPNKIDEIVILKQTVRGFR